MDDHKNAIELEHGDILTDDSYEAARIWITNGGGSSVWIDASTLKQPRDFGRLMADTVRHAARAYATTWDLNENFALQDLVDGFFEEIRDQEVTITTIQEGTLN